ncbi:hypothetical protein P1A28_13390 [Staphylococcus equorum]|uniref:hypothetical protein n=1 Tax=Staphylococcus equorum TaxID=246432 RepID=UPI0025550040|nr:hypothetical protein [Staphylococcus equorum]MDK9844678.1 hypothetical protein [Staphylococcus equorum]
MKFEKIHKNELKKIDGGSNSFIESAWDKIGRGAARYKQLQGQLATANAKAAHGQNPNP